MRKVLDKKFFRRKTEIVAKDLLGKYLIRKISPKSRFAGSGKEKIIREKITEVEAYLGPHDLACHSSKGRTKRTEIMYSEAGTLYIYLVYGMYWMLNIVTEEKDCPAAILIRATEHFKGPGVLTHELKIDEKLNGKIASKKTEIWFEMRDVKPKTWSVKREPRIGVDYAGPIWSKKKLRFVLK